MEEKRNAGKGEGREVEEFEEGGGEGGDLGRGGENPDGNQNSS